VTTTTTRKPERHGRPGTGITLNPDAGVFVGLDFGFRHVRSVVADVSHRILATTEQSVEAYYSLDNALSVADEIFDSTLRTAGLDRQSVLGIGVALPGLVDPGSGAVIGTSMVPTWSGANLKATLIEMFSQDVLVDNDSNCGALGEHLWGAGRGKRSMVYMKLHSGVGGALIVNGAVIRGVAGGAGEFGHITMDPGGSVCRCGGRGCLEGFVGIPALLAELRSRHGAELSAGEMLAMANAGDPACRRVLAEAGDTAGRALGMIANIMAPELCVVGGALAEAGPLVLEPLELSFHTNSILGRGGVTGESPIAVTRGALGRQASALGAVALVLTRLGVE
jgi:predicted NBD/HSP70 family sugar kinase